MDEALTICKHALIDIQHLLQEGFDTNIHDVEIDGVKDTCRELIGFIQRHDPKWEIPDSAERGPV